MTRDDEALRALDRLPHTRLANLPTPFHETPKLRAALGPRAPRIWLKRDDETGFALGGNKVRKLEVVLAPHRIRDVTHLITTGGPQSNHARVTAGAAAHLGLGCILVINGEADRPPRGNALLHRLFGAEIRTVPCSDDRQDAMEAAARHVADLGGRALVIPLGASTALGALGYARAALEIEGQLDARGLWDGPGTIHLVAASSSCGTLGGLAAGFTLLGRRGLRLFGVSADVPRRKLIDDAHALAAGALELLGSDRTVPEELIDGTDEEVGPGYGVSTDASKRATTLMARTEGVVLDPVYTAKAAAGMMRLAEGTGQVGRNDEVILLHTGGHPALFAHEHEYGAGGEQGSDDG